MHVGTILKDSSETIGKDGFHNCTNVRLGLPANDRNPDKNDYFNLGTLN